MPTWNKTKIVATIGPASAKRGVLQRMIQAGADVIRINGAHGSIEAHRSLIALVRSVAKALGQPTAILVDLPGPKYRVGELSREPLVLRTGATIALACQKGVQRGPTIPVPHPIHRAVRPGMKIFLNDGLIELRVARVRGRIIECRVQAGGELLSRKGINLPGARLDAPSLTPLDRKILEMAIRGGVDFVALSFVRSARDMQALRRLLKRRAPAIGAIAKIEKPEALAELDAIIEASDAVMVARGDLGIEVPFDRIPTIQRQILLRCLKLGCPAITATQMLESMISEPRPTRAEATDVAGAIWEGTDAVMLSAETSVGRDPVRAVQAMARIAGSAEEAMLPLPAPELSWEEHAREAQVLARAAGFVAASMGARAIVAPTRTGRTPLFISRNRPEAFVLAPTEDERTARRMNLSWGVRPMSLPPSATVDELLRLAERAALRSGFIRRGDRIVIASGAHGRKEDITRLIEVRRV